jgi:hypothetical protein
MADRHVAFLGASATNVEGMTKDQAIEAAGHDFLVERDGSPVRDTLGNEVPDVFAVRRNDTAQPLGAVGKTYKTFQNHVLYDLMWGTPGLKPVAAGDMDDGKFVYVVADIESDAAERLRQAEETIFSRFLITTTHDGSGALRGQSLTDRVWCFNQLNFLTGPGFKIRHSGNAERRLAEAQGVLNEVKGSLDLFTEVMDVLKQVKVGPDAFERLVSHMLPESKREGGDTGRAADRDWMRNRWELDPEHTLRGDKSGWRMVNLVSEYEQWQRGIRQQSRERSMVLATIRGEFGKRPGQLAQSLLARHGRSDLAKRLKGQRP